MGHSSFVQIPLRSGDPIEAAEWAQNDDVLHHLPLAERANPQAVMAAQIKRRDMRAEMERSEKNKPYLEKQRGRQMLERQKALEARYAERERALRPPQSKAEYEDRRRADPNYGTPFGQHDWHHTATQESGLRTMGNGLRYLHDRAKQSYIPGARDALKKAHRNIGKRIFAGRSADSNPPHATSSYHGHNERDRMPPSPRSRQ